MKKRKDQGTVFPPSTNSGQDFILLLCVLFQNERKHHEDRDEEPGENADTGQVLLDHAVIGVELELLGRLVRYRDS